MRGDRLLPAQPPKAGRLAHTYLNQRGVTIHYNSPYSKTEGVAGLKDYDLVINCLGQTYNAGFLKANFGKAVSNNNRVFVNDLMQVTGVDPRVVRVANAVQENIYCVGDASLSSLDEIKGILTLKTLAPIAAKNILAQAAGLRPSTLIPSSISTVAMISLGPRDAILVINGLATLSNSAGAQKFQFLREMNEVLKGNEDLGR